MALNLTPSSLLWGLLFKAIEFMAKMIQPANQTTTKGIKELCKHNDVNYG